MDNAQLIMIFAKLAWLTAVYVAGLLGGVFFHELGHALMALLVTRQEVEMEVGRSARPIVSRMGRLRVKLGLSGFRYGFTRYERTSEPRRKQVLVAAGGPAMTAVFCVACLLWMAGSVAGGWQWITALGLFVSNLRILVVSLWPVAYRPDGPEGEIWLSDTLDVWRMMREPRRED